jgi:hypothetical protein
MEGSPLIAKTMEELDAEASKATEMLRGKTVKVIRRHRPEEILIEFTDGTRLYVDRAPEGLELSIGGGSEIPSKAENG